MSNLDYVIAVFAFYGVIIGGFYCYMRLYDWWYTRKQRKTRAVDPDLA